MIQRIPDIGVIGNRPNQGHATGRPRRNTLIHELRGIDEQACGDTLIQTVPLQIATCLANLDEFCGKARIDSSLSGNNTRLDTRQSIIKLKRCSCSIPHSP